MHWFRSMLNHKITNGIYTPLTKDKKKGIKELLLTHYLIKGSQKPVKKVS